MIRNFYSFFLLFIVAITAARAQRTVDLEVLPGHLMTIGPPAVHQFVTANTQVLYDGKTKYQYAISVTNHGPDTLMASDILILKTGWGHITSWVLKPTDTFLSPGDTVAIIPFVPNTNSTQWTFSPPPGVPMPFTDIFNWCDSVGIIAGAGNPAIIEPDLTNNRRCEFIKRSSAWAVGINDVPLHEDDLTIYPNPATESVTIKFEARATSSATITLRDMMGKTVYSLSLNETQGPITHRVDIGHLPRGLYTAEFRYDNQTIFRKITLQ